MYSGSVLARIALRPQLPILLTERSSYSRTTESFLSAPKRSPKSFALPSPASRSFSRGVYVYEDISVRIVRNYGQPDGRINVTQFIKVNAM